MNYGNKKQVLGNNEIIDIDDTYHEEAPCNTNVVMPGVVILDIGTPSIVVRSKHHSRASK